MRRQGTPPVPEGKKALLLDEYKKEYLIVWDVVDGDEPSYEAIKVLNPTPASIKALIIEYYNERCREEILRGLTFEDNLVWLSQENQLNYRASWDFAKDVQEYIPIKVKLGTDEEPVYRVFETKEDFEIFISAVHYHIQGTIQKYWDLKDSVNWDEYVI